GRRARCPDHVALCGRRPASAQSVPRAPRGPGIALPPRHRARAGGARGVRDRQRRAADRAGTGERAPTRGDHRDACGSARRGRGASAACARAASSNAMSRREPSVSSPTTRNVRRADLLTRCLPPAGLLRLTVPTALAGFLVCGAWSILDRRVPDDASFWEAVIVRSQDPYLMIYLMWPALVVIALSSQRTALSDAHLVRRGSLACAAIAEAVRGGMVGVAAAAGMVLAGALVSLSALGFGGGLGAFSIRSVRGEGCPVLAAFATENVHPVAAPLIPLLASRRLPGAVRVARSLSVSVPPILFRAPVQEGRLEAIALLLPSRTAAAGLSVWSLLLAAGVVVIVGLCAARGVGSPQLLRELWRAPLVRWFTLALVLIALATLGSSPGSSVADSAFHGATPDGFSAIPWAITVICWQGLALVVLLRWSGWVLPRIPILALRHGSAAAVLVRELRRDVLTVLLAVPALLASGALISLLLGGSPPGWGMLGTLWGGGAASTLSTVLIALCATWITRRDTAAATVLVILTVSTLPLVNPVWPAPVASGGLG